MSLAFDERRLSTASWLRRPRWLPWREGPQAGHSGKAIVSLTEFRATHTRDMPAIYLAGLRLREGWYAMPGAVGMSLWSDPLGSRGGSLTVWREQDDLRAFVSLPAHLAIMRHYRTRGQIEAATWDLERCDLAQIRSAAAERIGRWR
jgi:heme-degrading monooxygenase HmoA